MNRTVSLLMRLNEATCKERTLYFGSSTSNLPHTLLPRHPESTHRKGLHRPLLYATNDKSYAAAFTFPWRDGEGFEFGKYGLTGTYILKIPYKYLSRLQRPCSLYTVKGCFSRLRTSTPEFISYTPVMLVDETRYESVSICLREHGVRVVVVQINNKLRREGKNAL